jgi:hypothetical protein
MSLINSTAEKLRRATALWHAYLTVTGQRFDLGSFLKDAEFEKRAIAQALASGDQKLVTLAQDWLRDTGQAVPSVVAARVMPAAPVTAPATLTATEAAKPSRYLRGVR